MILSQGEETGYWNQVLVKSPTGKSEVYATLLSHTPDDCAGPLCDVHDRRGTGEQATWPLNWRGDRGIMEVICPCGIGHPTPAQIDYFASLYEPEEFEAELVHGCCLVHCPSRSFE